MDDDQSPHRKVYARGYFDALRAMGVPEHERKIVSSKRIESMVDGLSGVARKAYLATPITEAWTAQQIQREIMREAGHVDRKTLDGCLASLVNMKLIGEPSRGVFKRHRMIRSAEQQAAPVERAAPTKPEEPTKVNPAQTKDAAMEATNSKATPIELLDKLSLRIKNTIKELNCIYDDVQTAAIVIQEQFAESELRSEKLKQLQQLLKGLG